MKKVILLIEDEENDVFFMKRAIEQAGIKEELHVARDGQEALDYMKGTGAYENREQFPCPKLVLLDLKLPHVMGLDILKWIRHESEMPSVIVIVFTSSRLQSDIDAAYHLGANSFVVKPSTPATLLETVKRIKDFWLEINQAPSLTERHGLSLLN